jgi:hypothetical protein
MGHTIWLQLVALGNNLESGERRRVNGWISPTTQNPVVRKYEAQLSLGSRWTRKTGLACFSVNEKAQDRQVMKSIRAVPFHRGESRRNTVWTGCPISSRKKKSNNLSCDLLFLFSSRDMLRHHHKHPEPSFCIEECRSG